MNDTELLTQTTCPLEQLQGDMNLKDLVAKNKVVNGYQWGYGKNPLFEEKVRPIIHRQREKVLACFLRDGINQNYDDETAVMLGTRFYSDDSVILRMESWKKEGMDVYQGDLDAFILDALVDCMKADYWYEFEKNWR